MMRRKLAGYCWGLLGALLSSHACAAPQAMCKTVLDYNFSGLLSGKPQSLCEYSGKVVLVVNTASECERLCSGRQPP